MTRKQFTAIVNLIDKIFSNEGEKVQVELHYKANGEPQRTRMEFCKKGRMSNVANADGKMIAGFCHMESGDEAPSIGSIEEMFRALEMGCRFAFKGITAYNDPSESDTLEEEVKISNLKIIGI